MNNIRIIITPLVVVLASFIGSVTLHAAPPEAKGQNVTVVNTTSNPVPVVQTGTTSVGGSVAITGTASVAVTNASENPVLVRDVDKRQPYTSRVTISLPATQLSADAQLRAVPEGKHLVIEYITARAELPTGQRFTLVEVSGRDPDGVFTQLFLPMQLQGPTGFGSDSYVGSEKVLGFVRAGETPALSVQRNDATGSAALGAVITGYLVDAP